MMRLAPQDRPREKLGRSGPAALGDNELLALVIGHGLAGRAALAVADALLEAIGGVHGLTRMTRDDMTTVAGIGPALASRVQAAVELGRRTLVVAPPARVPITSAREAALFLLPQFGAHAVERFGVLLLDSRHRVIRAQLLSVGSLDATIVHPREVFRAAALAGAAALLLFHNHPSGDPTPSADDVQLTKRLVAAGVVMGIDVIDHLVLADTHYCSILQCGAP